MVIISSSFVYYVARLVVSIDIDIYLYIYIYNFNFFNVKKCFRHLSMKNMEIWKGLPWKERNAMDERERKGKIKKRREKT